MNLAMQFSMGRNRAVKKLTIGRPERNCFLRLGSTWALGRARPLPSDQGYDFLKRRCSVVSVDWISEDIFVGKGALQAFKVKTWAVDA